MISRKLLPWCWLVDGSKDFISEHRWWAINPVQGNKLVDRIAEQKLSFSIVERMLAGQQAKSER